MKFILDFIKSSDFSSVNYYFHINGKQSFQTKLGGFLYLSYFAFLIFFIIKLFIDFAFKVNFNIVSIEKILTSPPEINLVNYTFNLGFSITYDNNTQIPTEIFKRYFYQKIFFITMLNSSNKIKNEIKLKTCDKNNFLNKYNDMNFNYGKFQSYQCIENTNLTLKGAFNDDVFQYIEYGIFLNYTTLINENMNFKNNFIAKNLIKVVLKYFEISLDVDNYNNAIKSYENNIYDYANFNKIKKTNIYFSSYTFRNDDKILFGDPDQYYYMKLNNLEEYSIDIFDRSIGVIDNDLLLKFYIRSSPYNFVIRRDYQKLWDMLANITGLSSNILFLVMLINTYYNKFKSKEELVNNLLKFKENYKINEININKVEKCHEYYLNNLEKGYGKNKNSKLISIPSRKSKTLRSNKILTSKSSCNNIIRVNTFMNNLDNLNSKENLSSINLIKEKTEDYNEKFIHKNDFRYSDDVKNDLSEESLTNNNNESERLKNLAFIRNFKDVHPISNKSTKVNKLNSENNKLFFINPNLEKINKTLFNITKISTFPPKLFEAICGKEKQSDHIFDQIVELKQNIKKENHLNTIKKMSFSFTDKKLADENINDMDEGYFKKKLQTNEEFNIKNKIISEEVIQVPSINKPLQLKSDRDTDKKNNYFNEIEKEIKSNREKQKIVDYEKIKDIDKNEENFAFFQARKNDEKINKKIRFDFSPLEIFCKICCNLKKSKKEKMKLYKKSYRNINHHMNIYFYLKLIQEIDIIKSLVFNIDQIALINFISKPMISNEINFEFGKEIVEEIFDNELNVENAIDSYAKILEKKNFEDSDHKLINMFKVEFESLVSNK